MSLTKEDFNPMEGFKELVEEVRNYRKEIPETFTKIISEKWPVAQDSLKRIDRLEAFLISLMFIDFAQIAAIIYLIIRK